MFTVFQHTSHLDARTETAARRGGQTAAGESYELRQIKEQPSACHVRKIPIKHCIFIMTEMLIFRQMILLVCQHLQSSGNRPNGGRRGAHCGRCNDVIGRPN